MTSNSGLDLSNPYDSSLAAEEAEFANQSASRRAAAGSAVWTLPAILIVALMWAVLILPGRLAPLTLAHFISLRVGPMLGVCLLGVWWLASRRLLFRERVAGLLLVFGTIALTIFVSHHSMKVIMMVYGVATALTALVAVLLLLRRRPWRSRRWFAFLGFAIVLLGSLFFRIGQMDAAFAFTLVPRWTPANETRVVTNLDPDGTWSNESIEGLQFSSEVTDSDWAEFRGPRRDGRIEGVSFDTDWSSDPPRQLWRRAVGPGWSSFCVVGSIFYTQEQRNQQEAVVAYRVVDGEPIWINSVHGRFEASMGGIGPRATPTFYHGRLYVTTATGLVRCLEAASGDLVWTFDLVDELDVSTPEWGFASSPLVRDGTVYVFAGGKKDKGIVALDLNLGFLKWTGGDGSHSYCSPQISVIEQQPQLLYSTSRGLQSLSLADGSTLWEHEWDLQGMPRVTQPLVVGNAVFLGTGYGNGTATRRRRTRRRSLADG